MKLGMVGLGRMGSGMTKRLEQHGHEIATYDPTCPRPQDAARRSRSSSTRRGTSG